MNENIGAKGGTNDQKRTLIIKNNKEKEELKQLEKEVEKKQLVTLLTAVPLVVSLNILKTLLNIETKEEESRLILPKSSEEDIKKERYIYQNDSNEMVEIEFTTKKYQGKKVFLQHPEEKSVSPTTSFDSKEIGIVLVDEDQSRNVEVIEVNQNKIPLPQTNETSTSAKDRFIETKDELTAYEQQKLEKLKAKKLVTEYEKMLKDVRSELRSVIFDYNVITKDSKKVYSKEDSEEIIERLNFIIKKIEQLKEKIKISDLDKYDDNYLYVLIEEYLKEFKDKRIIDEIKDSPLYISIATKLDELDEKKEQLKENIEQRKEDLELDEKNFELLKEKYADFEQMNSKLLKFQNEQDALLREIEMKVSKATTVYEKAQYKIQGATKQSNNLLKALSMQMMIPGARSARGLLTMTALSLHVIRTMFQENSSKRKYRTIKVTDYSKEIERSISSIEDITELLGKTTKEIDRTINEFKKEYKEYFGVIKACDELLENLEHVKDEISEKEYELNKLKDAQQLNLDKNNAKVKKLSENTL